MKLVLLILILSSFAAQALEIADLPASAQAAPMSVPKAPQPKATQAKPKPAGQTQAKAAEDCKEEEPPKPSLDETFCTVDSLNSKTEKR